MHMPDLVNPATVVTGRTFVLTDVHRVIFQALIIGLPVRKVTAHQWCIENAAGANVELRGRDVTRLIEEGCIGVDYQTALVYITERGREVWRSDMDEMRAWANDTIRALFR
jgi:hypothetical protein